MPLSLRFCLFSILYLSPSHSLFLTKSHPLLLRLQVHTRTAFHYLPLRYKRRMRILSICPAAFFLPSDNPTKNSRTGCEVVQLYKLEDPVTLAAHGYHHMYAEKRRGKGEDAGKGE